MLTVSWKFKDQHCVASGRGITILALITLLEDKGYDFSIADEGIKLRPNCSGFERTFYHWK